jgi:outer membrane protein, heavy metal efflux system
MRFLTTLVAAASMLLSGCIPYHSKPVDPAKEARAIEERSLEDPRLQAFVRAAEAAAPKAAPAHAIRWDLTGLTLAAIYFHPDLDVARSKLREAQGAQITARQVPNPSLSFEDMSVGPTPIGPGYTIAPVINFVIETAGRRTYRSAEQRGRVRAAFSELYTVFWRLRGSLRDALLGDWAARRRVALLQQRLTLEEQIVTSIRHRLAAGDVSSLELAREQLTRNQLRQSLADAEHDAASAPGQVAAAIGIAPEALRTQNSVVDVFQERPPALGSTVAQLQTRALMERTDLQGLLQQYSAAESALALEVARQYPNVTLSPGYSFDSAQNRYLFLPELEIPLFNHNKGPIAEAVARREEAAADISALQVRIIASVDEASATYVASLKSAAAADAALNDEEARDKQLETSLQAGAIDRPTLLAAEIEGLASQQAYLEARIQVYRALGALEDATQRALLDSTPSVPLETNPRLAVIDASRSKAR